MSDALDSAGPLNVEREKAAEAYRFATGRSMAEGYAVHEAFVSGAEWERDHTPAPPTDDEREALREEFLRHWYDRLGRCSCGHVYPSYGRLRGPDPDEVAQHVSSAIIAAGFRRQGPVNVTDDEREALIEQATWALVEWDTDTADRGVSDEHYRERRTDVERVFPILARRQGPVTATVTDDERDIVARAMCYIEMRSRAATLEEVQEGIQRWTRHRYEAERLLEELADQGYALRRQGPVTVTDGMTDEEKVVYVLRRSFHETPNDRAMNHIARTIVAALSPDGNTEGNDR